MAADKSRTQTWLAKQLGVEQPSVWQWLNRWARPDVERRGVNLRARIEVLSGGAVRADDWRTAAEQRNAAAPPARAA